MSELATTAPPPPLRLVRRSRTHGVEILSAPDTRQEDQALDIVQGLGRGIVESAKDGSRLCLGGGATPLEVVDTGDFRRRSLPSDTIGCERFAFSPKGSHLVTWQRPNPEVLEDGSLRVWSLTDDVILARSFHCKLLNRGGIEATIAWSGDERVAFHSTTNTIHIYDGSFSKINDSDQLGSIKCDGLKAFAASPGALPPYSVAGFIPEIKGKPAQVKVYQFPPQEGTDGQTCAKSFYRAQDVSLKWSPCGHGVLVQTATDVDATGGSYYGGTGLYLMQASPKKKGDEAVACDVPLAKEGPVAAAEWEPTKGKEFVVIAGQIPPATALYNLDAEQIYAFGCAHRNTICWSPHGRFLALGGFGNLAGDVDFWDRNKKKKIGSVNFPCAVTYGWSPDSRLFLTATTAPRMNVDNGIQVYRYDGSGPISSTKDRDPLFDCFWLPGVTASYPDRGVSPGSKARMRSIQKPEAVKGAYRPPGARGLKGGGSLASMIRAEREKDKGSSGTIRAPKPSGLKLPVGAAPEAGPSRNARRKEAAKKRKEQEAAQAALEAVAKKAAPIQAKADVNSLSQEDLKKEQKKLKKKLKNIEDLEAKVAAGLAPSAEQAEKLGKKGGLVQELAAIEKRL